MDGSFKKPAKGGQKSSMEDSNFDENGWFGRLNQDDSFRLPRRATEQGAVSFLAEIFDAPESYWDSLGRRYGQFLEMAPPELVVTLMEEWEFLGQVHEAWKTDGRNALDEGLGPVETMSYLFTLIENLRDSGIVEDCGGGGEKAAKKDKSYTPNYPNKPPPGKTDPFNKKPVKLDGPVKPKIPEERQEKKIEKKPAKTLEKKSSKTPSSSKKPDKKPGTPEIEKWQWQEWQDWPEDPEKPDQKLRTPNLENLQWQEWQDWPDDPRKPEKKGESPRKTGKPWKPEEPVKPKKSEDPKKTGIPKKVGKPKRPQSSDRVAREIQAERDKQAEWERQVERDARQEKLEREEREERAERLQKKMEQESGEREEKRKKSEQEMQIFRLPKPASTNRDFGFDETAWHDELLTFDRVVKSRGYSASFDEALQFIAPFFDAPQAYWDNLAVRMQTFASRAHGNLLLRLDIRIDWHELVRVRTQWQGLGERIFLSHQCLAIACLDFAGSIIIELREEGIFE